MIGGGAILWGIYVHAPTWLFIACCAFIFAALASLAHRS
jgi:hypothetical protein